MLHLSICLLRFLLFFLGATCGDAQGYPALGLSSGGTCSASQRPAPAVSRPSPQFPRTRERRAWGQECGQPGDHLPCTSEALIPDPRTARCLGHRHAQTAAPTPRCRQAQPQDCSSPGAGPHRPRTAGYEPPSAHDRCKMLIAITMSLTHSNNQYYYTNLPSSEKCGIAAKPNITLPDHVKQNTTLWKF